ELEIIPREEEAQGKFLGSEFDSDDELYDQAREIALETGKVSASFLQRKLQIGYARAARLLDMMEEEGIIGPQQGAKPREVIKS
ncbi:MAG: DNA translocase FtsK, partial [Candidatus Portnoybacteria bacterium]|nr:DNA translocase FtsK [Candidatus Portnoybacteria bacterium]